MDLLLDTHVLLWWLADDCRLTRKAHELIKDPANGIFVSAATAWEIAIKQYLGKLRFEGNLESVLSDEGFTPLAIGLAHAIETRQLPPIHPHLLFSLPRKMIKTRRFNNGCYK